MLYPIVTVVCLLLRGHFSLQRKDMNSSLQMFNEIKGPINSCSIEELSKLLSDRIAMNKAIELAALNQNKPKQQIINNILKLGTNEDNTRFDSEREVNQNSYEINQIFKFYDN